MSGPISRARLIGPSLMAAAMFVILVALGVWQLHRLTWKRGILAAIDHAEAAAAVTLPDHPGGFEKVAVTGRYAPNLAILYGADVRDTPRGPVLGAQLIQPLIRAGAVPLLVDRGWLPDPTGGSYLAEKEGQGLRPRTPLGAEPPTPHSSASDVPVQHTSLAQTNGGLGAPPPMGVQGAKPLGLPSPPDAIAVPSSGMVTLQGYIRPAEHPGLFSAKDDPANRRFYTLDPAAMAAALGLKQAAPFTLVLLGPETTSPPIPATALPRPPNDHLNYAITWFSLAAVLVGVFAAWVRRSIRS